MLTEPLWNIYMRWLAGQATAEERQELTLALLSLSREELSELVSRDFEVFKSNRNVFSAEQSEALFERISKDAFELSMNEKLTILADERKPEEERKVIPLLSKPWWRTGAAAAVASLLLIAGGYFWYRHNQSDRVAIVKTDTAVHDALPGGNKATLILSNGSTIILDSAGIGHLASQGAASIAKTDSGRIAYNIVNTQPAELLYNTMSTPRGGQYQLTLADGTKVWLNAASSIKYPVVFMGAERVVEITGEVYFEVVHNDKQPFKVKVGDKTIEDIGTAFNINAYVDENAVRITLIEGAVKVSLKKQVAELKQGQQAAADVQQIKVLSKVDLEQVMAWKNGLFAFRSANLPTILRELSRWYDVDVVYEGAIPERHITGEIGKTLTLDQVLRSLTRLRVYYTIEGKKLTIRPK